MYLLSLWTAYLGNRKSYDDEIWYVAGGRWVLELIRFQARNMLISSVYTGSKNWIRVPDYRYPSGTRVPEKIKSAKKIFEKSATLFIN